MKRDDRQAPPGDELPALALRIAGASLLASGLISGFSLLRDPDLGLASTARVVMFFVDMILGAALVRGQSGWSSIGLLRAVVGGPILLAAALGDRWLQVLPMLQSIALLWLIKGPAKRAAVMGGAVFASLIAVMNGARVARGPQRDISMANGVAVSGELVGTTLPWKLTVPEGRGWQRLPPGEIGTLNSGADLWIVRPSIEAGLMVLPELTAGDDVTTERFADAVVGTAPNRFAGFNEISRKYTGEPGAFSPIVLRARGEIDGQFVELIYGFFSGPKGVFQVYAYAPTTSFSQVERDFTQMISSFVPAPMGGLTTRVPTVPVAEPAPPPDSLDGIDLTQLSRDALRAAAEDAIDEGAPAAAAVLLAHAVRQGAPARGDLASALAASGDVAASIYWLQQAALTEGIDPFAVNSDPAFDVVRRDVRWPTLALFLGRAARDLQRTVKPRITIVTPSDSPSGKPLPVLIGLPGLAFAPEDLVGPEVQPIADELKVIFVGVSGPVAIGEDRYRWTENHEIDLARVEAAIDEVSAKHAIDRDRVALMGYAQGAQVAFELAMTTSKFTGAIVLSPGAQWPHHPAKLKLASGVEARRLVITYGAELGSNTEPLVLRDEALAMKLKLNIQRKAYDGVGVDAPPPDAFEMLPEWIRHVLSL